MMKIRPQSVQSASRIRNTISVVAPHPRPMFSLVSLGRIKTTEKTIIGPRERSENGYPWT